jgi:hypothetical protein
VPLIEVGMPVPLTRNVASLYDNFELGLVPDHSDISVESNRDELRLPIQVADLASRDASEILLFRECPTQRVDELKVLGVERCRSFNITRDQRTESLAFSRPEKLSIPLLATPRVFRAGHASTSRTQQRVRLTTCASAGGAHARARANLLP